MSKVGGFKKMYTRTKQTVSNWDRFKAWRSQRKNNIKQFQASTTLTGSLFSVSAAQSQGYAELAAKAALARVVDKKA